MGICPVGICPVGICPGVFVLESYLGCRHRKVIHVVTAHQQNDRQGLVYILVIKGYQLSAE